MWSEAPATDEAAPATGEAAPGAAGPVTGEAAPGAAPAVGAAPTSGAVSEAAPSGTAAPAAAEPSGVVYDIQGFSVQDGPGIRTTIFLKGCPLHCPWCHSPESQRFDIQLSWQWRKCIGIRVCGVCLSACPRHAIGRGEMVTAAGSVDETTGAPVGGGVALELVTVDWNRCDDCGACAGECPSGALSLWGRRYTVSDVVARVVRDKPFFERSGGGVTISGGEPLSQPEFTLALLRALKDEDIQTALDTTAFATWEAVERTLPYVDLYLVDLKHMESQAHKAAVGVPNERILDNMRRLAAAGASLQVRMPVIPRFSDAKENMRAAGAFLRDLGEAVALVQVLPYHAMGVPKWERIKHAGPILEATAPSDEQIGELKAILEGYGLKVQVH